VPEEGHAARILRRKIGTWAQGFSLGAAAAMVFREKGVERPRVSRQGRLLAGPFGGFKAEAQVVEREQACAGGGRLGRGGDLAEEKRPVLLRACGGGGTWGAAAP
jgi:hypothetical protein